MSYDDLLKNVQNKKSSEQNEAEQRLDYLKSDSDTIKPLDYSNNVSSLYNPEYKNDNRDTNLSKERYHDRLLELNLNADSKHYVLFFGMPGTGKSFIIGSLLHYMKNILGGTIYLDNDKSTRNEFEFFSDIQDWFSGNRFAKPINRTSKGEYFEFHIHFTPKDTNKPKLNIVFVDASGEDSKEVAVNRDNKESGEIPNYLRVILESEVNTKLVFVYDKFLQEKENEPSQITVLDQMFNKIQYYQRYNNKTYPKILLFSKSDLIKTKDESTVNKYDDNPKLYAKGIIPTFANGFFNENPENDAIFYQMGTFSGSDRLLKFEEECPEQLFRWLYKESIQEDLVNPPTCWEKFMSWFKGE